MLIEHLAVLLALVVLANLVLFAALVLPRLAARRNGLAVADTRVPGVEAAGRAAQPIADTGEQWPASGTPFYERVVRVVSYSFIGAALFVVTITGLAQQPLTYVLLATGAFLIVLGQDVLPLALLGRLRFIVEAFVAIAFVTILIMLTGGHESPFFFGYLLLLAAASLWAEGAAPFALALLASGAYLLAVTLAPGSAIGQVELGRIGFNVVALALVSYVAAVIGREQRRVRESALRLSRIDVLTGLHTRGYFETAIEREVVRAQRTGRPFSLLLLDVDGLKAANDRYGHESGDRLLRATAEAIQAGIRASDFAARYGGDEFVVVLPDTDQLGALNVGEKLRFDISRLALRHDGELLQTSVSVGLVSYPDDGRSSAELLRRVDMAMYEAKRRGRNQLVRYARPGEQAAAINRPSSDVLTEEPSQPRFGTIPINRPDVAGTNPPQPPPWDRPRD